MTSRRSAPRSKNGCWTCRARKVKCDECQPICANCEDRALNCDYAPRLKPKRRQRQRSDIERSPLASNDRAILRAGHDSSASGPIINKPSIESSSNRSPAYNLTHNTADRFATHRLSVASPDVSRTVLPSTAGDENELPLNLTSNDWPIPLTSTDCQAIHHYIKDFVPRMVLKTPQWSSYSALLHLCTKHALLAHLVVAFSVRDMAHEDDAELDILAIEHYRKALGMFIEHLGSSNRELWITFPALWLFIHYEQQYGDSPRALQRHLEGVRDVVDSHGYALFPGSIGGSTTMNVAGEEMPRQILDRLALWTIYHDAAAATFGFGGGLIRLLKEQYPGSIERIRPSSSTAIRDAWGSGYPPEENFWDLQVIPLENLMHDSILLRYELSLLRQGNVNGLDAKGLISIGRKLKQLEQEYSSLIEAALSRKIERTTILSNMCVAAAIYLAVVIQYERLAFETCPSAAVSKTLQACASLHEYEGDGYMRRVAWPMFAAGLEIDDPIHQSWLLERFDNIKGTNMKHAAIVLKAVFLEKRRMKGPVDYLSWIKAGKFQGFVI